MSYEIIDIEGEESSVAERIAKQSIRILDQIVFNKFGGIKYSLQVSGVTNKDKDIKDHPFKLNFTVEVDVDKTYVGSPTYDSDYYQYINNLDDHIDKGLRYLNLNKLNVGVNFNYINETFIVDMVDELNKKLHNYLISQLKGVTIEGLISHNILYYLQKDSENIWIRSGHKELILIEFHGEIYTNNPKKYVSIENLECDELYEIMEDIYSRSRLSISYEHDSFICTTY